MNRGAVLMIFLFPVAACDEMAQQPRYDHYEASSLFADGKAMQASPEGTVARTDPAELQILATRPPLTMALLQRGRERYGIYCTPCHDAAGYGKGTIPSRGYPEPPSLHLPRLRAAPPQYTVDVITNGHGVMYSFADRVMPADRWAIAAYVEALRLSQDLALGDLTPEQQARVTGGGS